MRPIRILSPIVTLLAAVGLLAGPGATTAHASPCQLVARGGPHAVNWPGTATWATVNPTNNRSVCFVAYLEGQPGARYYAIGFDVQDLIDTGSGGDTHNVCAQYRTPGTTVWHTAVCDTNSADWTKNGNGGEWKLVVDTLASGNPCGWKVRTVATDALGNRYVQPGDGSPGKLIGCW